MRLKDETRELFKALGVPLVETADRLPRYAAQKAPGQLLYHGESVREHQHTGDCKATEYAAFEEPTVNLAFPHLTDGIYVRVTNYQGRHLFVDGYTGMPDERRGQYNIAEGAASFEHALVRVAAYIKEARRRVAEAVRQQQERAADSRYKVSGPSLSTSSDYAAGGAK